MKRRKPQADALIALNRQAFDDGFCVRWNGDGCGWRHSHSPTCPYRISWPERFFGEPPQ